MFYNCITGECESCNSLNCNSFFHYYFLLLVGSGYGFQLNSTCYNITYQTSSATVPHGTYLFSFTIFIEEGTTGTIAGFRVTPVITFSGPSQSAFSAVLPLASQASNITQEINAGWAIDDEELTYGSYSASIGIVLVPPFTIVYYPVNIEIVGKSYLCYYKINYF